MEFASPQCRPGEATAFCRFPAFFSAFRRFEAIDPLIKER
jgi:hypothetical protein